MKLGMGSGQEAEAELQRFEQDARLNELSNN